MAASKTEIQILLRAINKTNNVVSKITEDVKKLSTNQERASKVGERLKQSQDRVNKTLQTLATAQDRAARAGRRLEVVQKGVQRQMVVATTIARRLSLGLFSLASGYAAVRAAQATLRPSIETETFETQFAVLLGSFDAAIDRIADLREFNKSTPFELPGLVNASVTLQTLTEGALAAGDGLRLVGDVAVGTRQPIEELAIHIGRAYDGLNNGRPVGESLHRLQELGIVSGRTRTEIENLQKEGAKGAEVWNVLARQLERFRGTTELGSKTFAGAASNLSDTFRELRENFSRPVRDVLTPILESVSKHLSDLAEGEQTQAAGDAVAAFIRTAAEEFRGGRFVEFVGLAMEAGIEQGSLAFRRIVAEDLNWYESKVPPIIARSIAFGFLSVGAEIVRDFTVILASLKAVNDAFWIKIGSEIKEAALSLGHGIVQGILQGMADGMRQITGPMAIIARTLRMPNLFNNKVIRQLDQMTDSVERLAKKSELLNEGNQSKSFADVLTEQLAEAEGQAKATFGIIDDSLSSLKRATDFRSEAADGAERELTATQKLQGLMATNARRIERDNARRRAEKDSVLANAPGGKPDGNPQDTRPGTPNALEKMGEQITRFQEVATAAATVMHGTFNGISESIEGLISGTMRWGDALRNIAGSIVQSIIRSFADMAAAYIVNQLFMRSAMKVTAALGSGLRKAEAADTIATESSKTGVLATNATLASISSFGTAAIIGLALVTAAIAAIAGGFQSGGYTGDGAENAVAGSVHGKEFVLHAAATRRYRALAEAMNAGARPEVLENMLVSGSGKRSVLTVSSSDSRSAAPGGRVGAQQAIAGGSQKLNVAFVDNRQSVKEWFNSTEGKRTLVNLAQQHQAELGLPS